MTRITFLMLLSGPMLFGCTERRNVKSPAVHAVHIRGFQYIPAEVNAAVGDTIVWINDDIVPHTATRGGLDTGSIGAGESMRYVVHAKGTHQYLCTFHPTMKGALVVQ